MTHKLLLPENGNRLLMIKRGALVLLLLQLLQVVSSNRLKIDTGVDGRAFAKSTDSDHHHNHRSMFHRMTIARKVAAVPVRAPNLDDVEILLAVKAEFRNGGRVLADWNNSSAASACNWTAVTCGGPTADRVVKLSLGGMNLNGSVPPSIGRLQYLQHLNLSYNDLTGSIPSSLGNCTHLVYLNLEQNQLEGEIPYFGDPSTTFWEIQTVVFADNHLTGPIPEWFGDYSSLTRLSLGSNKLTGGIPSKFAQLSRLESLDLSYNKLSGPVNLLIANFSALVSLALDLNDFDGPIPSELGALQNLENLFLGTNAFVGPVPVSILTNCTKLKILLLENNGLTGEIPPEVGRLQALEILYMRGNRLTGTIPVSFSNCSSLSWLSLDDNQLVGDVPPEFGMIKTLGSLNLWNNNLTNILPETLANCTSLYRLTFGRDNGTLVDGQSVTPQPFPPWIGSLVNMSVLDLMTVGLYGPLPDSLFNLTQLVELYLPYNNLSGPIPDGLGKLTQLQQLDLTGNQLTGPIPDSIGSLSSLWLLHLGDNFLEGSLPSAMRNLFSLEELRLDSNNLSGEIPSERSFWSKLNLTTISLRANKFNGTILSAFRDQSYLELLDVSENALVGPIPTALGSISPRLKVLTLAENRLTGAIPIDLFSNCFQLISVQLQKNDLSGTIPESVGNLTRLTSLDVSSNRFSGAIPSLANMTSLSYLNLSWNLFSGGLREGGLLDLPSDNLVIADLSHNNFSGPLAPQLSSFKALEYLDLSVNSFSGTIPQQLSQLEGLIFFNVSYNQLEGPVPTTGVFLRMNLTGAFLGNPDLCGSAINKSCTLKPSGGSRPCKGFQCTWVLIGVILGSSALLLLILFSLLFFSYKKCFGAAPSRVNAAIRLNFPQSAKVLKLSAEDLKRATDDFSSEYLIGEGAGTKVYKFVLPESDQMYAAKVLHSGPSSEKYEKLLIEEIRALSKLRHRNVLRVVGFCSNEEVKAAILDYMPNGSLHGHLHGDPARGSLPWETRLNIALGIAQGLVYLHNEFPEPIIHRDLKPMNVLLDSDWEPKICDLGLVKFVYHHEAGEASATALCGTIGYIPPEYTTSTRVSTKGDVYAYGIIILELLTGRQPTENSFDEAENIVAWAQQASSASVVDILDPALVQYGTDGGLQMQQETLLLQVALLCCQFHPQSRPSMRDVLGMLLQIKETSSKVQNTPTGLPHSEEAT